MDTVRSHPSQVNLIQLVVRLTTRSAERTFVDDGSSWARIVYDDSGEGIFSGHVFTGGRLYELKYFDSMGGQTLASLAGDTGLGDIPLSASTPTSTEAESDQTSSQSLLSSKTEFLAPRAIRIGIVVDSRYNEYHYQQGLVHALGIINGVDGLYQSQLGLAVVVDRVVGGHATPLFLLQHHQDEARPRLSLRD